MGNAQFSALLKLVMIRAGLDLRRRSLCTGTDLGAAIAAVTLIGHTAHVVTVNACWAYVFRPGGGLVHITRDHPAMATQAGNALADPETPDAHPRHDRVFVKVIGELAADDIDVEMSELVMHPGDLLLLGSPGLPRALSIPRIETQLRVAADPRVAASLLVRAGTHLAEKQDFSVIVVKPHSEQSDWLAEFGIATTDARVPWRSDSATDHLSEQ